jgi:hypothetical protein
MAEWVGEDENEVRSRRGDVKALFSARCLAGTQSRARNGLVVPELPCLVGISPSLCYPRPLFCESCVITSLTNLHFITCFPCNDLACRLCFCRLHAPTAHYELSCASLIPQWFICHCFALAFHNSLLGSRLSSRANRWHRSSSLCLSHFFALLYGIVNALWRLHASSPHANLLSTEFRGDCRHCWEHCFCSTRSALFDAPRSRGLSPTSFSVLPDSARYFAMSVLMYLQSNKIYIGSHGALCEVVKGQQCSAVSFASTRERTLGLDERQCDCHGRPPPAACGAR